MLNNFACSRFAPDLVNRSKSSAIVSNERRATLRLCEGGSLASAGMTRHFRQKCQPEKDYRLYAIPVSQSILLNEFNKPIS